jgi:hypothetical protein
MQRCGLTEKDAELISDLWLQPTILQECSDTVFDIVRHIFPFLHKYLRMIWQDALLFCQCIFNTNDPLIQAWWFDEFWSQICFESTEKIIMNVAFYVMQPDTYGSQHPVSSATPTRYIQCSQNHFKWIDVNNPRYLTLLKYTLVITLCKFENCFRAFQLFGIGVRFSDTELPNFLDALKEEELYERFRDPYLSRTGMCMLLWYCPTTWNILQEWKGDEFSDFRTPGNDLYENSYRWTCLRKFPQELITTNDVIQDIAQLAKSDFQSQRLQYPHGLAKEPLLFTMMQGVVRRQQNISLQSLIDSITYIPNFIRAWIPTNIKNEQIIHGILAMPSPETLFMEQSIMANAVARIIHNQNTREKEEQNHPFL